MSDWLAFVAASSAVLTAIVGGFFAVLQGRGKNKTDFQNTINGGFAALLGEHRKDVEEMRKAVKDLREEIDEKQNEIETLETRCRKHVGRIMALESQIRRAGFEPVAESDIIQI